MTINYARLSVFLGVGLFVGAIWAKLATFGIPLWAVIIGGALTTIIAILGLGCLMMASMQRDE